MAEFHGGRIAAVFAADTAGHTGTGLAAKFYGHLHQFAYADGVETRKRIGFVNLICIVSGQEFACVVAGEPERHLRKIVGAEAEELRLFGDLVRGEGRSGNL